MTRGSLLLLCASFAVSAGAASDTKPKITPDKDGSLRFVVRDGQVGAKGSGRRHNWAGQRCRFQPHDFLLGFVLRPQQQTLGPTNANIFHRCYHLAYMHPSGGASTLKSFCVARPPQDFAFEAGAKVTTVGELTESASKLRRDLECDRGDTCELAQSTAVVSAELTATVAEIFAEALRNVSAAQVRSYGGC